MSWTPNPVYDAVLAYHRAGICCFPLRLDGKKRPQGHLLPEYLDDTGKATRGWKPLETRMPTAEELARWFGVAEPCGIAGACGAVSGNREVIDFDVRATEVFAEWCDLVQAEAPGLLARLCVIRTPREPDGGYHVCYRSTEPVPGNQALAREQVATDKQGRPVIRPTIETRGEGGYTVLPGSPLAVHETGRPYLHVGGPPLTDLPVLSPAEREVLIRLARSFNRQPEAGIASTSVPGTRAPRVGDDYDARGPDWQDILGPHGWECTAQRGSERRWRRPDKGGCTWSATTGFCKGEGGSDLLHVFSSSAHPFELGKSYGKFNAYAILNHGGDRAAAAKELAGKGYGEQRATAAAQQNGRAPTPAPAAPAPPAPEELSLEAEPEPWPAPPADEAYHGLAGIVVARIEPHTEADPVALLAQFLTFFGGAVGRNPYRTVGRKRHHPNLFAVLVGRTAKGRKGTSLDWIEDLFRLADPVWSDQCVSAGLSTGEGLISAVRDRQTRRAKDGTEETTDEGAADKRLLVVEEEFAQPLRLATRDGNILSAVIRQAWDGGRLRTLTRNNPLRATDAHVSIVGHVTRDELVRCLSGTEQSNGFANRFLWLAVRRSKLLPDGGDHVGLDDLARRLADVLAWARHPRRMDRTLAARDLWHAEYPRLSAERPGAVGLCTNRAEAQVLRLATTYALLDGAQEMDVQHYGAAIALWDYCERSCRWIFGETVGNADADEILGALRAAGQSGLSGRDVRAVFAGHRTASQLARALALLVEAGLARCAKVPSGGRPVERWFYTGARAQSAQSAQRPPEPGNSPGATRGGQHA